MYNPAKHKTARKSKDRCVLLDAACQSIIAKYATAAPADLLFRNTKGHAVIVDWLDKQVRDAIEEHGLPKFTPYQIRHTAGTEVSKEYDRDAARAFLGHTSEAMTRIYDHSDLDKIRRVLMARQVKYNPSPQSNEPVTLRLYQEEG